MMGKEVRRDEELGGVGRDGRSNDKEYRIDIQMISEPRWKRRKIWQ